MFVAIVATENVSRARGKKVLLDSWFAFKGNAIHGCEIASFFSCYFGHSWTLKKKCNYFCLNYTISIKYVMMNHSIFVSLYGNFKVMRYTIFLTLEPYLAQWLEHECGGKKPIPIKRGSAEADLLEAYLQKPPRNSDYQPQLRPLPGEVEIKVPYFKYKESRTYNYLSPRAKKYLRQCIRNRFKVQLWKDIESLDNTDKRLKYVIEEWMEAHGINVDDKNWNTIAKIEQRTRAVYYANRRLTNHNSSKHSIK